MVEFDPADLEVLSKVAASAEDLAVQAEAIKLAAVRSKPREAAIDLGRRLGEQTADAKGETGPDRDQRVRRAMAYAAWEYDGKPAGGAHLREFGVPSARSSVAAASGPDLKAEKPVKKRSW